MGITNLPLLVVVSLVIFFFISPIFSATTEKPSDSKEIDNTDKNKAPVRRRPQEKPQTPSRQFSRRTPPGRGQNATKDTNGDTGDQSETSKTNAPSPNRRRGPDAFRSRPSGFQRRPPTRNRDPLRSRPGPARQSLRKQDQPRNRNATQATGEAVSAASKSVPSKPNDGKPQVAAFKARNTTKSNNTNTDLEPAEERRPPSEKIILAPCDKISPDHDGCCQRHRQCQDPKPPPFLHCCCRKTEEETGCHVNKNRKKCCKCHFVGVAGSPGRKC